MQIEQAGLAWSKQTFFVFSAVLAVVAGVGVFVMSKSLIAAAVALLVGGLGMPRWYLKRRKTKRLAAFAEEFANALDVIIRGVKAGLPLGDCLRIIASEVAGAGQERVPHGGRDAGPGRADGGRRSAHL